LARTYNLGEQSKTKEIENKFERKYDKQDHQGKAAFNEHNPNTTLQQEPVASSQGGPQRSYWYRSHSGVTVVVSTLDHLSRELIIEVS
jgi:hypothetical protein